MSNNFEKLLGHDADFCATLRAAQIVAAMDTTVLILGESGTGKELLATAIHQHSHRVDKPFVAINCAALPEHLVESELFGHRKGAFTSASTNQQGRIQAANGGTLFLDEIGELPLSVQAKLLRFLEAGECQSLGQTSPEKVNVRVVAATNRNLYEHMQQGLFREDLYYRLNIVPLELPPLRKRKKDINLLLNTITAQLAKQYDLMPPTYTAIVLKQLREHNWQGNIRELRNFCERMIVLYHGKTIEIQHLPAEFKTNLVSKTKNVNNDFVLPDDGINFKRLESSIITQALQKAYGNRSQAAKLLGMTRDTLLYRIKKYAIDI